MSLEAKESYIVEVWRKPDKLDFKCRTYLTPDMRAELEAPRWHQEAYPRGLEEATLKAIELREIYTQVRIATTLTYYQEV